jgi:nicotinate-nucleotide adenylyltransferase
VIGLFGGAFDPPHDGHVALADRARAALGLDGLVVVVAAEPGHKVVTTPAGSRFELARAAFPDEMVVLDDHRRTVDMLRDHPEWDGAVFLLGADEFASFLGWKEPEEVLRRVRLGVATRPGYPREVIDPVLMRVEHPERVEFFKLEPHPIASSELRARLDRGEDVSDLVPAAVWKLIVEGGLYGLPRYTGHS